MSGKLVRCGAAILILASRCGAQTGVPVPELEVFDRLTPDFLARWHIQGGSLAIAKDGRLVFARGYGWANVEAQAPVDPESLFRIASVSKAITAAGVMRLVEQGRLDLDASAFRLLDHLQPPPGTVADPRLFDITVRQLLNHTAGFDKDKGGATDGNDPMRPPMTDEASDALGAPRPASPETIICYMMGRPLDFDPGTRYAYSSFGYCVLARIIEKITGKAYAAYIQENILGPAGITRTQLGRTRVPDLAPGEVRYYNYPSMPLYTSVFGEGLVPFPYGAYAIETIDASGGWISSAMDLVRFASVLDGARQPALLQPETLQLRLAIPQLPSGQTASYGLGCQVRWDGAEPQWWHFGGTPYSTSSYLVRMPRGIAIAVLFNGTAGTGTYFSEMETMLTSAAKAVQTWPAHDLFPRYYAQDAPAFPAGGVVNAASFVPGAVAPGEIVTIFGERLGPVPLAVGVPGPDGRLDTTAAGTRVLFDGVAAPVVHSYALQVSAIVPYATQGRETTELVVEYQGARSATVTLRLAQSAPGLFGVALNSDWSLNSESNPAARGDYIFLYSTGEGQTSPAGIDGTFAGEIPARPVLAVDASMGGQAAEVLYAGAAPGFVAGVMQVKVAIPRSIQVGNAVPVVLRVGSTASPSFAIAIR